MTFGDAIRTCFSKYADFSGRARPSEYWWWVLFVVLVETVLWIVFVSVAAGDSGGAGLVGGLLGVVVLALIIPSLAVFVRRMHDTGRSGWFWFLGLVPIVGPIILIVFLVQPGDPGANKYGEPVPLSVS